MNGIEDKQQVQQVSFLISSDTAAGMVGGGKKSTGPEEAKKPSKYRVGDRKSGKFAARTTLIMEESEREAGVIVSGYLMMDDGFR